jgi:hypothetical protein
MKKTRIMVGPELKWTSDRRIFVWPQDVEVGFPDGEVWDCDGGRDSRGHSLDHNFGGRGSMGSPCAQAMIAAGIKLEVAE